MKSSTAALPVLVHPRDRRGVVDLRDRVLRHALGQVAVDAARPVVRGVHPRARHRLVDVHQVFALAEAVEERRHRADVERMRAEPQQVIEDARDLVEHHADVLRADRHLDAEQLLDRQGSTRARCTSSTRSRAGPCTAATGCTSCTRPASRSRDAAGRCADRRARSLRRRARARGAARRAPPDAAGQSSSCSCESRPCISPCGILRSPRSSPRG